MAVVYACCQHCVDYDEGEEFCVDAPHQDDPCSEMWDTYCAGKVPIER